MPHKGITGVARQLLEILKFHTTNTLLTENQDYTAELIAKNTSKSLITICTAVFFIRINDN